MLLLVVCFVLRISLYKDDGLVDFKIKNYAFFKKHYNSQKCQNNAKIMHLKNKEEHNEKARTTYFC